MKYIIYIYNIKNDVQINVVFNWGTLHNAATADSDLSLVASHFYLSETGLLWWVYFSACFVLCCIYLFHQKESINTWAISPISYCISEFVDGVEVPKRGLETSLENVVFCSITILFICTKGLSQTKEHRPKGGCHYAFGPTCIQCILYVRLYIRMYIIH